MMFLNAKRRAKKNGLAFTISRSHIVIPDKCPVYGIPLSLRTGKATAASPSLDRIDNSLGYEPGNVAVISLVANADKGAISVDRLRRLIGYIEKHKVGA